MTMPIGPWGPEHSVSMVGAVIVVDPAAQASTNAWAAVADSDIDTLGLKTACYTLLNAAQTIQWRVVGANVSDFSDAQIVQAAADVLAAATATYTVAAAPYRYYRVEIIDKVGGSHGTATVHGIGKA